MQLNELTVGQKAVIHRVRGEGAFRKRILEMGFVQGRTVELLRKAPLGDPSCYSLMGYQVSLRRKEAELVDVTPLPNGQNPGVDHGENPPISPNHSQTGPSQPQENNTQWKEAQDSQGATHIPTAPRRITVALLGNPNSGKTTLFNLASGLKEHTGNYCGVTVESRTAHFAHANTLFELTDLPGTYSIEAYAPEERYVAEYLQLHRPDVILNVVDSNNLERNLYLTLQLLELGIPVVVALNMWDEFQKKGHRLNRPMLSDLLGAPCVPTVGRTGKGIDRLLEAIAWQHAHSAKSPHGQPYAYNNTLQEAVRQVVEGLLPGKEIPSLHAMLRGLEGDNTIVDQGLLTPETLNKAREALAAHLEGDTESYIADCRYARITTLLNRTLVQGPSEKNRGWKRRLDSLLTHRILGLPLFFLSIWFMFWLTFTVGEYPMQWIESGVELLSHWLTRSLPEGPARDLLVGGIIGGVGSVIVFLPQILLLFLCISVMEETGYMARAVFLIDRAMRGVGLHGRSFIPLVMGFGCNVPAVMATRSIENRNVRLVTMLIVPFMSCSARLPVYVLFVPILFPGYESLVLFSIYLLGILVGAVFSILLRKGPLRGNETPFVLELPPYRLPTIRSTLKLMWEKASQYLKKMGTVILLASIIIWALTYFPIERANTVNQGVEFTDNGPHASAEGNPVAGNPDGPSSNASLPHNATPTAQLAHYRHSYLGQLGCALEPIFLPLGFDWRVGVALLTGVSAKEVVVSTLGLVLQVPSEGEILGTPPEQNPALREKIRAARYDGGPRDGELLFTTASGLSLLVFVALYVPCIAAISGIRREAGSWKWALFAILHTTTTAYLLSWVTYQAATFLATLM